MAELDDPGGEGQLSLFGPGEDRMQPAARRFAPDPEVVRARLNGLLAMARGARVMPWPEQDARQVRRCGTRSHEVHDGRARRAISERDGLGENQARTGPRLCARRNLQAIANQHRRMREARGMPLMSRSAREAREVGHDNSAARLHGIECHDAFISGKRCYLDRRERGGEFVLRLRIDRNVHAWPAGLGVEPTGDGQHRIADFFGGKAARRH